MNYFKSVIAGIFIGCACISAITTAHSQSLPVCQSVSSDPDQDGYGWENNSSCLAIGAPATTPAPSSGACVDPDGDGWGWDGTQSCQVGVAPVAIPQTSVCSPVASTASSNYFQTFNQYQCSVTGGNSWDWTFNNNSELLDASGVVIGHYYPTSSTASGQSQWQVYPYGHNSSAPNQIYIVDEGSQLGLWNGSGVRYGSCQ